LHRYVKGARSERELIDLFYKMDYSVMRSAGSGINSVSPDILVFKNGRGLAFECKAWNNTSLSLPKEKLTALKSWQQNTNIPTYVAWRMNRTGWFFIKPEEFSESEKNYTLTSKIAIRINRRLSALVSDGH
jgi:Holliday junction resolvase